MIFKKIHRYNYNYNYVGCSTIESVDISATPVVILIDMNNYSPFIHCFMILQKAFSFHESFVLIYRMNQRED